MLSNVQPCATTPTSRARMTDMSTSVKRLFHQFHPSHYTIELHPNREKATFHGTVTIRGKRLGRPSQRLTLHQEKLTITKATITKHEKGSDTEVTVDRINHHANYNEVRLHSSNMLYPGEYTIELSFKGKITRQMNGMYPCLFEHDGVQKQLIATQFESHHAREVFPCIDEPEAKATFDLILHTPAGEPVIANTPIKEQVIHDKIARTVFETTPIMSTYLLAFIYGEMGYKEAKTRDGVVVRTYATPALYQHTEFALSVAVKCLEYFNDYFAIPYPLQKCDLIALPDFASGAMENWGCLTFREHCMIVDPNNTTLGSKQYVAMVVAHEVAHQWFGNLVTMRWWTDLWLNEGFASWIEYMAIDSLFPEWQMWTQFIVDEQQHALKLDALEHTHPIEVTVHHPDEIRSIFDTISYAKGASVIHMLHEYLGPEAFRDGLRHYLKRHAYGNTDTVDLWQALEEISGKPVKSFMHAWTAQPGFPLLQAQVGDTDVELTQERFFINPEHTKQKEHLWPIPLQTSTPSEKDHLDKKHEKLHLSETQSLVFNSGRSGFYRTAYNATHLERLGELIKRGKLSAVDRLGVLSDLQETAKVGKIDTVEVLHFLENFRDEHDYAVWGMIAATIGSIKTVMNDDDIRQAMKPYIRTLVAGELQRLGWEKKADESHFDQLLRPTILGLAAAADEPSVVKRCEELFADATDGDDHMPDLSMAQAPRGVRKQLEIDPDMRGVVFGTVARRGDERTFEALLALHNASDNSEERTTLAAAITDFKQPELINRALSLITTDTVRLQDVAYWIAYSFLNRKAQAATWEWMKDNWEWLHTNLGTDMSFCRMPIYAARIHSDKEFIPHYTAFFEPKLTPALDRSYRQGLEMLQWQSAWRDRAFEEVKHFFATYEAKK